MFNKDDRVKFIDGKMTRLFPKFYPSVFSKGTIIQVDDDTCAMRYLVKWDNPKVPVWYFTDKEISKC